MKESLRQKILLLLLGGLALGCTYSPHRHLKIVKGIAKEWQRITEKELAEEIRKLYRSRLVRVEANSDGSQTFVLSGKGKLKALTYKIKEMKIARSDWDGKWRLVVFDIPEKLRHGRNALRERLKHLGFYELQKSVFVFPYRCEDEIDFVIEFFDLRRYVRVGLLEKIDNEPHLKKVFRLS